MRILICLLFVSLAGFTQTLEESIQLISNLPDTSQVDSMVRMSRLSAMEHKPDLGVQQAKWAYEKALNSHISSRLVMAQFYIARNYQEKNQTDSAIVFYQKTLKDIEKYDNAHWRIHVVNNLVNSYQKIGEFKKAIELGLGTIEDHLQELDSGIVSELYTNVGYTYDRSKDFRMAIKYHRIALEYVENKESNWRYFIESRIGIAYDDLGFYDSAHYYNQKALQFFINDGDSVDVGAVSSNIGNTYLKQRKWQLALRYLLQACRISMSYGDEGNRSISHTNLGHVYIELDQYIKAKEALSLGIKYAILWDNTKFLSEAYLFNSKLFEKLNQEDSALFYFKEHKKLEDSLYASEKINRIKEFNAKYATAKKEKALAEEKMRSESLSKEVVKAQLIAENRSKWIILLISIVIGVVLLFMFLRQRNRRKAQEEKDAAIIKERDKGTNAVFLAQEEERKRISKDLHDGVGQQLSGLKMALQKLEKNIENSLPDKKEEVQLLAQIVSNSADEVRSISHQMMPRALTELGLLDALDDMLEKSLGLSGIQYDFEHYGIEKRLPEKMEISLYRVSQELINNIIKHSGAQKVSVQLFKNQQKIIMIVEDDGKGIRANESKGHGLLNMKSRINTLNGEINLEPSPNSGTLATIRIPL